MPIITYTIQKSICKSPYCWYYEYEQVLVDVSDEVAAFLAKDNKREQQYYWKIKKQLQDAKIKIVFSLDKVSVDSESDEEYIVADLLEDSVNVENRNPLNILIQNEDNAALELEYSSTMTKKQYEVFQLYNQGYNNTEVAKMLKLDESSVRERLYMAFRTVVGAYLIHSNTDIFHGLQAELYAQYGDTLPKHKFDNYLSVLFINRLSLYRPDQAKMINYVIETDYEAAVKKYFSDFITETPEKGT